ncbi:MAG TPA: ATP-binding protein [Pyrinomonadaceae bacterium]|nr:ATP-binding protein [Pyrinomonadaceae bacterium]
MNLRAKLLLVFLVGSLVPVLLVGTIFYRNSVGVVERMLREDVEAKAARVAHDLEAVLHAREVDLNHLAQSSALRDYARGIAPAGAPAGAPGGSLAPGAAPDLPGGAQAAIESFISRNQAYYSAITLTGASPASTPVRFEPPAAGGSTPRVKAGGLLPGQLRLDERVWTTYEQKPLRSNVTRVSTDAPCIVYTVPVFSADEHERVPRAALVAELKLDALLQQAGSDLIAPAFEGESGSGGSKLSRLLVVLDSTGQVVYHTNHALNYQPIGVAMPYFAASASEMQAGASATRFYTVPTDGARWLASYKPVAGSNLSVAVAGNYTRALGSVSQSGLFVAALSLLVAGAAAALLFVIATRAAHRIERVTEAAAVIADGDLNHRIEVHSSDETHALAQGFNRMSDRLRELIAREAETRQFQSFLRLSAMLTHDLKNSITGLSMLVTNMERQFHRAEFREDAISSLKQATEKLSGLVARLSEPVRTLSGEFWRTPQPADLIPVIRRVLAQTAHPSSAFYDIQTELPDSLVAPIDAERIERVVENLVVNAFEAMGGRGGRLTVAAGHESAELIFFSVEDTGAGMTEDFMRTRLFRAFATTKKRGIGLGLYTCREIVESHGGRLEVKSKLGSGTRFRVVLPSIPLMASHTRSFEKPPLHEKVTKTGAVG